MITNQGDGQVCCLLEAIAKCGQEKKVNMVPKAIG